MIFPSDSVKISVRFHIFRQIPKILNPFPKTEIKYLHSKFYLHTFAADFFSECFYENIYQNYGVGGSDSSCGLQ